MFTLFAQGDQSPTVSPARTSTETQTKAQTKAPTTVSTKALAPAAATTPPDTPLAAPVTHTEPVRHMIFGSLSAVQSTIKQIHLHGYAEPNDWSLPISTGRANEVMAILTKRVGVGH